MILLLLIFNILVILKITLQLKRYKKKTKKKTPSIFYYRILMTCETGYQVVGGFFNRNRILSRSFERDNIQIVII
jgi:hypothetical protein